MSSILMDSLLEPGGGGRLLKIIIMILLMNEANK